MKKKFEALNKLCKLTDYDLNGDNLMIKSENTFVQFE